MHLYFEQLLHQDPYLLDEVSFASSRNILHIAEMRGQVGIIEEVLKINPGLARDLDSRSGRHFTLQQHKGTLRSRLDCYQWLLRCAGGVTAKA